LEDIMVKRIAVVVAILALPALLGVTISASVDEKQASFTVHEWGTFTSVAGPDGKAAQWLPLAGPGDLPCFVERFQNRLFKDIGPVASDIKKNPIDYAKARTQLLGPIRMETPVVYFYSERPEKVNLRVAFPKGFITEWYPKATLNQTPVRAGVLQKSQDTGATIVWKDIEVLPRNARVSFPQGSTTSHYYAARETEANPIRVNDQNEKFLFYRGVGGFPVPVNVTVTDSGKVRIKYLGGKPYAILFESRGGKLGYSLVDTSKGEVVMDTPPLTGNFESLRAELEAALVSQGLFAKEASAMVETWRDSWFEEGTRLFYIVPPAMVEEILPLTMQPRPAKVVRVFVGRVEVFTASTIKAVETAVYANDKSVIATYGRFLGPILERVPDSPRANAVLESAFKNYISQPDSCGK
jgi:hypothetical protein